MNVIQRDAGQMAIHRSLVYRLFAQLYEYPEETLYKGLTEHDLLAQVKLSVLALDADMASAALWSLDPGVLTLSQLQDDYTRLFDVGATGRPPCPLMGGAYAGSSRMKNMEECLRFYNHFGLKLNQDQKAMPDQLGTELEFLHFLSHQQAALLQDQQPADAYRRAERDFLKRELLFWVPKMNTELGKIQDVPFYKSLSLVLESFCITVLDQIVVVEVS